MSRAESVALCHLSRQRPLELALHGECGAAPLSHGLPSHPTLAGPASRSPGASPTLASLRSTHVLCKICRKTLYGPPLLCNFPPSMPAPPPPTLADPGALVFYFAKNSAWCCEGCGKTGKQGKRPL